MTFKESLLARQERNAVVSTIAGEKVYLKKGGFFKEWGQVYPLMDEQGKVNWMNVVFGGWKNLVKLVIVLGIVGMVLFQFKTNFQYISALKEICEPCLQNLGG